MMLKISPNKTIEKTEESMKYSVIVLAFLVSTFAHAQAPMAPEGCNKQAKEAALALEGIFGAEAFKPELPKSKITIERTEFQLFKQAKSYIVYVNIAIPTISAKGNSYIADDKYVITMVQDSKDSCYLLKAESGYAK